MTSFPPSLVRTFAHPEPIGKVFSLLRAAVRNAGLEISFEWDLAYDLRQDYGVALAPCRVFCIYSPINLLRKMVLDDAAAVTDPVLVSVSEHQGHTRIQVPGSARTVLAAVESCGARRLAGLPAA